MEQAALQSGMTVLEIRSGGLNAAMIAEVVGETGHVLSVDIDPDVISWAKMRLEQAGYCHRVRTVVADGGVPDAGPFDAIIVTVGAWDIAPAWLNQLVPDGTLVLPLIMNGVTRTIGFRRTGHRLISTSTEVAGFVPMQGAGRHAEHVHALADANGRNVNLRFDADPPTTLHLLDGLLTSERTEAWSQATIGREESFADLHLWFAWFLPGFCRLAPGGRGGAAGERSSWFSYGVVRDAGLAYLVVRPALDSGGAAVELGARAYGSVWPSSASPTAPPPPRSPAGPSHPEQRLLRSFTKQDRCVTRHCQVSVRWRWRERPRPGRPPPSRS
ncbi:methyltransferase, FxLD system [Actinoplanes sp. NPDC051633]|uniref:methyltransferase, FxLD system n=1 Tax=Actinoplanes sp. NPDC051633 TaxID=3155670 RepID=UPI00341A43DF